MLIAVGIDIEDAAADGKLTRLVGKIFPPEVQSGEARQQGIHIQLLPYFDVDGVFGKSLWIDYFFHQRFGVGNQHLAPCVGSKLGECFGTQHYMGSIQRPTNNACFLKRIGEEKDIQCAGKALQIIVEISRFFLVAKDNNMVALRGAPQRGRYESGC